MAQFSEKIINEFCRMCAHMKYSQGSTHPYVCLKGSTVFTGGSRNCSLFKDRSKAEAESQARERKVSEDRQREDDRRSRREEQDRHERQLHLEAEMRDRDRREYAKIEQAKIDALAELEEAKLQRKERLQEKAQSDREKLEIRKSLQEISLMTINEPLRANQSLRILLISGLFMEHVGFVTDEIAKSPALQNLVSQILNENAIEAATSIMKSITKEALVPKLLELQDNNNERIVLAILDNKMPEQQFGVNLREIFNQEIKKLAKQMDDYQAVVNQFCPSANSNQKLSDSAAAIDSQTSDKMLFSIYHNVLKIWESLLNEGKGLFTNRVDQILNSLNQVIEEKKLEIATTTSSVFLGKMLQHTPFKREFDAYVELNKEEGWTKHLYPLFYSSILFGVFYSYFELDLSPKALIVIVCAITLIVEQWQEYVKNKKLEERKAMMAWLIQDVNDNVEVIACISTQLDKIIAPISQELNTGMAKIVEFYQKEKIDLGSEIQKAFIDGSTKMGSLSRAIFKTTYNIAKMATCQKAFSCEYFGRVLKLPTGQLYYSFSVNNNEAKKLGEHLTKIKFISPERYFQIDRDNDCYVFRFFSPISQEAKKDENYARVFGEFADSLSANVFNGNPVVVYWCDPASKEFRRFKNITIVKKNQIKDKFTAVSKLKATLLLADPRNELAGKLLESMIAVASIDGKIGEIELEALISFSCQLKDFFSQPTDVKTVFEHLIQQIEPIDTFSKFYLLGLNGVYFWKKMQPKLKKSFLAEFKKMVTADNKVTSNENKCFEILEITMFPDKSSGPGKFVKPISVKQE